MRQAACLPYISLVNGYPQNGTHSNKEPLTKVYQWFSLNSIDGQTFCLPYVRFGGETD